MATFTYQKSVEKISSPSIVRMELFISVHEKTAKDAVIKLDKLRTSYKKLFLTDDGTKKLNSLIASSYLQTEINVRENFKTVTVEVKTGREIKKENKRVQDGFVANTTFGFTLANKAGVIDDFVYVLNIPLSNKDKDVSLHCDYSFDIKDTEREAINLELYSQAIDECMADVQAIIDKSKTFANYKIAIKEINQNNSNAIGHEYESSAKYKGLRNMAILDDQPIEEIITPDLVKDIFENKKIITNKTLWFTLELSKGDIL